MTKKKKNVKKKAQQEDDFDSSAIVRENVGDTLQSDKKYEGLVYKTGKNSFEVMIDQRHQVLVFRERFAPSVIFPQVPITCFIALGNKVILSVIPSSRPANCIQWLADRCWVEDNPAGNLVAQPLIQLLSMSAIISHVTACEVHLFQHPDTIVVRSDIIELFGHNLINMDLTRLFQTGDELEFEPSMSSVGLQVQRAWYGSYRSDKNKPPTSRQRTLCLEYCSRRELPKETILSLMLTDDLKQREEDAFSDEELQLKYIDPPKKPSILSLEQLHNVSKKKVSVLPAPSPVPPAPHQERHCLPDKDTVLTLSGNSPTTADAATQTFSTGDIVSFFAVAHDV